MKTGILGVDFAEGVRSAVCTWMEGKEGVNEKLCDAVLFSTLDANFMSKETTASGRSVHAVTTLPLLSLTESISFLGNGIEATFVDGQGMPITNRDTVVRQLALASGGHPRSMEYIIKYCNYQTELVETPKLKEVIVYVAAALCRMYNQDNCVQLLHDVLLGKMVNGDDLLVSGNSRSESYRSPVMRGVLIDSFMVDNPSFIPTVPELYLHRWVDQVKLDKDIRGFLDHILQTHYGHTSVKFEIIHSSWGQLMRHIRKGRLEYAKIPLNDLYRLKLREGAAPVL